MEPSNGPEDQVEDYPALVDFCQNCSKLSSSHRNSYVVAFDSGYGSSYNVTPLNTPNVSCNLTSNSSTQRGSKSTILNTELEGSDKNKITPVTQNNIKFTQFHITSPQSCTSAIVDKRHANSVLSFEGLHSTPKKLKIDPELKRNIIEYTPPNLRKSYAQKKLFRRELKSAPEFNNEQEDEFQNISVSRRSNLSPITIQDSFREKRIPLSDANINFLKSSTPKVCRYNSKPSAMNVTTNFTSVRGILSFADQRLESLTKQTLKGDDSLLRSKFETPNKKILLFKENYPEFSNSFEYKCSDIYQEESLKKINSVLNDGGITERHNIEARHPCFDEIDGILKSKNRKLCSNFCTKDTFPHKFDSQSESLQLSCFRDFLNIVPTSGHMEITPLKPSILQSSCLELEWTFEIGSNNNFRADLNIEPNRHRVECDSKNTHKLRTPPLEIQKEGFSNEKLEYFPHTPKKQKLLSIKQERIDILYPTIPKTPSKRAHIHNLFKKKLGREERIEKRSRKYYDGITQLNIISKLESYTLVLDRIFDFLSSQDIFNFVRVSKSWKKLVQLNSKANWRLKKYLHEWKQSKENNEEYKPVCDLKLKKDLLFTCKQNENISRAPFTESNKNEQKWFLDAYKSPPVSPSKRKFYENQKVVHTLADKEKLIKCPRCAKPSRVITAVQNLSKTECGDNSSSILLKSSLNNVPNETFQAGWNIPCTLNTNSDNTSILQPSYNTLNRRSKFKKSLSADLGLFSTQTFQRRRLSSPMRPFAECSGLGCKFRFCLRCFCEYHPGTRCKLLEPVSPSKEDQQNGALQINSDSASRNFKSRRKSLKRLCF